MGTQIKICGITMDDALETAIDDGADFLGFVFFDKSPRALDAEKAAYLVSRVPDHINAVGLFVDASDEQIAHVLSKVKLDMLQLHGNETPQRLAALKSRFHLPVIKAVKVSEAADLLALGPFQSIADWILFDAKPPQGAALPGGNGMVFDWQLLKNLKVTVPWMLSGGLDQDNIRAALSMLAPDGVDVSSGVEDRPGVKNPAKIRAFIQAVKGA